MAEINSNQNNNDVDSNKPFLCGVVEGFYGRPWTPEQRKDLFSKQEKWGMNCYLYAPKDDYKHRAYWRELYTVEEAEHMQALISQAKKHNTTFYYAISPGLDIAYSSQKEIATLKRKLDQVQQLGCTAFAVLFDDVDPEMSGADKEVYQSFGHAQVSVANEIFGHLNQPKFMFCPTQYCSTRAVPSVQTSEYLNTLGSKLAPEIDIMWTGPKVISKTLTIEHIREVSSVLRRPPVIWDNLHANDYDQARLFLGPYCGRSTSLKPLLRGVVTNPNCEYGPNFIAIHTLAQWARSATEENIADGSDLKDDAVSADIRLETEDDENTGSYCPNTLPSSTYHPRRALHIALQDWLLEFRKSVLAAGPITQPQILTPIPIVPSVNTCMSLTSTTPVPSTLPTIISNVNQVAEVIQDANNSIPTSNIVMNSLVSETKINTLLPEQLPEATAINSSQDNGSCNRSSTSEPMDCNNHSPIPNTSDTSPIIVNNETAEEQMVVDPSKNDPQSGSQDVECNDKSDESSIISDDPNLTEDQLLTMDDLLLLADLFYLPFEHGKKGINLMTEFNWLKSNSHLVIEHNRNNSDGNRKPEVQEWFDKAAKFTEMTNSVKKLSERLLHVRNRSLLYELYPYVWDMRGVVSLLNSYVQWLGFSKGWREAFMSGDQEPWIFRGGLTAELQRLIPVDASNDLFIYKAPDAVVSACYVIRPYQEDTDRGALYSLVLNTADDGKDGTPVYSAHPSLPADVMIGSFLRAECSECVVMVVEDGDGALVGYCCAAPNARAHALLTAHHITTVREHYPKVVREEGTMLTACDQLLASLWDEPVPFPLATPISPPTPPTAMSQGTTPPPPPASSTTPPIEPTACTPSPVTTTDPVPPPSVSPEDTSITPTTTTTTTIPTTTLPPVLPMVADDIAPPPTLTPSPTPSPDLNVTSNNSPPVVATTPAGVVAAIVPVVSTPTPTPLGDVLPYYPATLRLAMLPSVLDESISKRLMTCILACLRAKGGFGGHVTVSKMDKANLEQYAKLGFNPIGSVGDNIYMARSF